MPEKDYLIDGEPADVIDVIRKALEVDPGSMAAAAVFALDDNGYRITRRKDERPASD